MARLVQGRTYLPADTGRIVSGDALNGYQNLGQFDWLASIVSSAGDVIGTLAQTAGQILTTPAVGAAVSAVGNFFTSQQQAKAAASRAEVSARAQTAWAPTYQPAAPAGTYYAPAVNPTPVYATPGAVNAFPYTPAGYAPTTPGPSFVQQLEQVPALVWVGVFGVGALLLLRRR